MPKPPRPWTVTPHGPIQKIEDNLWAVDGDVPGMKFHRRMAIVRRADGSLVFYNAMPLAEPQLAEVKAWGKPEWLVVPNAFHCMDAHAFRERLGVKVVCAKDAEPRVSKVVALDGRIEDFPRSAELELSLVPGTKQGEAVMTVTSSTRTTLVFSDAFMNVPKSTGILNALLRTAGGPKCPPLFRLAFTKDKRAVRAELERLADTPGLFRLIPSHGDVLDHEAAKTLREVAARDL